jgi:hypothetical protein
MPLSLRDTAETDTAGSPPANYTVVSGTWPVHTTTPIEGAKSYGNSSPADDALMRRNGVSQTDMRVAYKLRIQRTDPSNWQAPAILLRCSGGAGGVDNGYLVYPGFPQGTFIVYRKVSGGYQGPIATQPLNSYVSILDGRVWNLKAEVSGVGATVTIGWKLWADGQPEPAFNTFGDTNAARVTAAGSFAFRTNKAGTYPVTTTIFDDVRASDAGVDYYPAAAAVTLTGPGGGPVSVASRTFTVASDGSLAGSVVVTPSDGGAGGVFTPTTVTLTAGNTPSGTFTYTPPATPGTRLLTLTNNGGLANPTALAYAAFDTIALTYEASLPGAGAPVGYTVLNDDGTTFWARSTAGVSSPGGGRYAAGLALPALFSGRVLFDDTVRTRAARVDFR